MEPGLAAAKGKEQTGNLQTGVTSDESLEAVTVMTAANLKKSLFLTGVLKSGLRPASGREARVLWIRRLPQLWDGLQHPG